MTKLLATLLLFIMLLYSCSNNVWNNNYGSRNDSSAQVDKGNAADSPAKTDYFKVQGDSILISPFEIEVILSRNAKDKIVNDKETIIVNVTFDGAPKQSLHLKLEEDGSFFVATTSKEILYGQIARFDNIKISKAIYDQLADKDFNVGVNVYSGRKSSQNNLLNCEPLFDKISNIANKKFILNGKLIYGDD